MQNAIQMALKWLFFAEKSQNCPAAGGFAPIYDMLELHQLTQNSAQMRYFSNKDILTVSSSNPLAKFWLST